MVLAAWAWQPQLVVRAQAVLPAALVVAAEVVVRFSRLAVVALAEQQAREQSLIALAQYRCVPGAPQQ